MYTSLFYLDHYKPICNLPLTVLIFATQFQSYQINKSHRFQPGVQNFAGLKQSPVGGLVAVSTSPFLCVCIPLYICMDFLHVFSYH